MSVDITFAKKELTVLFEQNMHSYIPAENLLQVEKYLLKNGVMSL